MAARSMFGRRRQRQRILVVLQRSSAARGFDEDVQVEQKEDVFSPRLPKEVRPMHLLSVANRCYRIPAEGCLRAPNHGALYGHMDTG